MKKKTIGLILPAVLVLFMIVTLISKVNSEKGLSNEDNEYEVNNLGVAENINENIDLKSDFPYGEEGLEIVENTELKFTTDYNKNYFRVAFENTGNNQVSIWITSPTNSKQYYKLEIPAYSYEDVYFGGVAANIYLLDITGDRGGECKGILNVEIMNIPFE
ncbi:MAG: hypothetical protein AB2375_03005 [Tissierellaceae bacterium]